MIFDSLEHIDNYCGLGDVYTALKLLKDTNLQIHLTSMTRPPTNDGGLFVSRESQIFRFFTTKRLNCLDLLFCS